MVEREGIVSPGQFEVIVIEFAGISSAELAYVALQTPVIMAVHASELLPNQENGGG